MKELKMVSSLERENLINTISEDQTEIIHLRMTWRRLLNKRTKFTTRKQSVLLCREKKNKKKTRTEILFTISNSEQTLGKMTVGQSTIPIFITSFV